MLYLYHATDGEVQGDMMYFFGGSLVLLISAMRNAWFLMLQEAT